MGACCCCISGNIDDDGLLTADERHQPRYDSTTTNHEFRFTRGDPQPPRLLPTYLTADGRDPSAEQAPPAPLGDGFLRHVDLRN